MSPEQAQGLTTVNHRSDVWGLGVVLYEALAGVPTYPELGTYQETILKILTDRPPLLSKIAPWVPEGLARVVHDAIEHDVEKRIPDCAVFAASDRATALPEAVMGSTGGWGGRRMGSSANLIDPAFAQQGELPISRPITLGDDTQVVVRASDPGSHGDDDMPSKTMLAAEVVRSTRRERAEGHRRPARLRRAARTSSADVHRRPRCSSRPPGLAPANDGPTTMKSLAIGDSQARVSKPMQPMMAAALTAIGIILFGVVVLALTRSSGVNDAAAARPGEATDASSQPAASEPPPEPPMPRAPRLPRYAATADLPPPPEDEVVAPTSRDRDRWRRARRRYAMASRVAAPPAAACLIGEVRSTCSKATLPDRRPDRARRGSLPRRSL